MANANAYQEKIVPIGTSLFKGLRYGPNIKCIGLETNLPIMYFSDSEEVAKIYASNYLCSYEVAKPLRLFVLNRKNVEKMVRNKLIPQNLANGLKLVTGTNVSLREQVEAFKKITSNKLPCFNNAINNKKPGERISITEINRRVFGYLCSFLSRNGYDGYYASERQSMCHGGTFHKEIAICKDSFKKIRKVRETNKGGRSTMLRHEPILAMGNKNAPQTILDLFAEYIESTKSFGYGKNAPNKFIFLTGGRAAESVLNGKNVITSDYDMTFVTNTPFETQEQLNQWSKYALDNMTLVLNNFVELLKISYPNTFTGLTVAKKGAWNYQAPRLQNRFNPRYIYGVYTFYIKLVNGVEIDFLDLAVCYIPNMSGDRLRMAKGFPVLTKKHMLMDLVGPLLRSVVNKNRTRSNDKLRKDANRIVKLCPGTNNSEECMTIKRFANAYLKGNTKTLNNYAANVLSNNFGYMNTRE